MHRRWWGRFKFQKQNHKFQNGFGAIVSAKKSRMLGKSLILAFSFFLILTSCDKSKHACYDRKLENKKGGWICLQDCPGVTGCDGQFYCNECIANSHGITIVE